MIPTNLSAAWNDIAPALGNHLWQSTLFAGAAGLLTLFLRKNRARARYGLWLAASVKFSFRSHCWSASAIVWHGRTPLRQQLADSTLLSNRSASLLRRPES